MWKLADDRRGLGAVEYSLMLGLIVAGLIAIFQSLSAEVADMYDSILAGQQAADG